MKEQIISSVSYRQEEIITNILRLYVPNGIDADLTYSKGFFYKSGEVPQPKLKFDIAPQTADTVKADSRAVPLKHNYIINLANESGLYCEDIFVLLAYNRLLSSKHINQKHARKYHSYFLVFRKNQKLTDAVRRNMNGGIHRTESAAAH